MHKLIQQVKRLIDYYTPRRCTSCGRVKFGVVQRDTGTAHVNDALNYRTQCPCCHNHEVEYWSGLWAKYRLYRKGV